MRRRRNPINTGQAITFIELAAVGVLAYLVLSSLRSVTNAAGAALTAAGDPTTATGSVISSFDNPVSQWLSNLFQSPAEQAANASVSVTPQ